MKILLIFTAVSFLLGSMICGCAKDEAVAQIEREMLEQQGERTDTTPVVAPADQESGPEPATSELAEVETGERPNIQLALGTGEKLDPRAIPESELTAGTGAILDEIPPVGEEQRAEADMPKRPDGTGFEVQIAGCEDQEYARSLISTYQERGYEPYVAATTSDGRNYYRVRLGVFPTFSEAERVRQELQEKYAIDAWVDPVQ